MFWMFERIVPEVLFLDAFKVLGSINIASRSTAVEYGGTADTSLASLLLSSVESEFKILEVNPLFFLFF